MKKQSLAISQILESHGPEAAEKQLIIIGDQSGDNELSVIVRSLEMHEVADVVGQGDYTKPSIAAGFITGEQFKGSLERFASKWGSLGRKIEPSVVTRMCEELEDYIASVILTAEDDRRQDLTKTLLSWKPGNDVLILLAVHQDNWQDFLPLQMKDFNPALAQRGTWQELYGEINSLNPELLKRIKLEIEALYPEYFDEERDSLKHPAKIFVHQTLRVLSRLAMSHVSKEKPAKAQAEEVFADV